MDVLYDGIEVWVANAPALIFLLAAVCWGFVVIDRIVRISFVDPLETSARFSLGIAGWPLPLLLLGLIHLLLSSLFGIPASFYVCLLITVATLIWALRAPADLRVWAPFLFFAALLMLYLAMIRWANLPFYVDSAIHDSMILSLKEDPAAIFATGIYHIGYHVILNFLTAFQNIPAVMLLFGQIVIACLPFPIFHVVKKETTSDAAACFAVLLAALGWHMPLYAVNWGKYPALIGLLVLNFAALLAFSLWCEKKLVHPKRFLILFVCVMGVALLFHSRTWVVALLVGAAVCIAYFRQRLPVLRTAMFIFVAIALVELLGIITDSEWMHPLVDSYSYDVVPLLATAMLIPAVLSRYSAAAFSILVFAVLLLMALFVPLDGFEIPYESLYLMDRPFAQMILFIPLSIYGGLGFGALYEETMRSFKVPQIVWGLMLACAAVVLFMNKDFRASPCCQIASLDDLAAISWISENLPADARIAIASSRLKVGATAAADSKFPADGGVWIDPLAGRETVLYSRSFDFTTKYILGKLCREKISYVYIGKSGLSFNEAQFMRRYPWYQPVFMLPDAKIYKVIGCVD